MALKVKDLENALGRYLNLLDESRVARGMVKSWGLSPGKEIEKVGEIHEEVLDLVARGVEELVGG